MMEVAIGQKAGIFPIMAWQVNRNASSGGGGQNRPVLSERFVSGLLAMICASPRFVFVHIPKNAGSSIQSGLAEAAPAAQPNHRNSALLEHLQGTRWTFPAHIPAQIYKEYLGRSYGTYYSFAFVRNPWARLISHYHYSRKVGLKHLRRKGIHVVPEWKRQTLEMEFDRWALEGALGAPQSTWLFDGEGNQLVDFVGRVESIEADFAHICSELGIHANLPWKNTTRIVDYRDMYSKPARMRVQEAFESDIERFQYQF